MMPRGVKSGCAQSGCPVGVPSRGVKSRECPVKGWSGCQVKGVPSQGVVGVPSRGVKSRECLRVPSRGAQSGCPVGVPSRGAQSDILNLFNHACRYKWT